MGFKDEKLWKILTEKAEKEDQGLRPDQQIKEQYLSAIESICQYGVDRALTIRDTFPMYTLHDETHICNVLRLMDQLLGDKSDRLSRDETAMLVLCACCHDIGMSYSEDDKEELFEDTDRLNRYLDTHHGEYVKAYQTGNATPQMTEDMIQDYLRSIHHERIRELLLKKGWPRILNGRVECNKLIQVCQSHGEDCVQLEKLDPAPHIDLRFCGVLLRLADILDFDTSRAPEAVYDYSGFGHVQSAAGMISKEEWQKHLASNGFDFSSVTDRSFPYPLNYSATCCSMQVEQTINCYLDWVDRELIECNRLLQKFNGNWKDFILPGKISRHITSSNYVSGQYRLTLDQDQVLQLFTGENLYNDPAVFVRELIQNAIDAVRTRKQLDKTLPADWEGQINIRCWMDEEGYHWFRIEDNGTGMTENIIRNYFLKIGCSYYNSDEFMQAKLKCRADLDYMPISRFGIGILSCFMGDKKNNRVEVSTKHFNEDKTYYPALRLSMHGINGYFYLADKNAGHIPGPMIGKTEQEQKPYLNQPGTVIAVRTNLYQSGMYTSFKDIVDKYVMFPEVRIHYEDEEQAFDYPTEQEFMDEVHAFQPSDDPEKRGVLEIPISEEEFQKLYDKIPELAQVKRPLPKILLKCVALDEYTKSPYLNGIILMGKLEHDFGDVEIEINGEKYSARVKIKLLSINTTGTMLAISLNYSKDAETKIKQLFYETSSDPNFDNWFWAKEEGFSFPEKNKKTQYLEEYKTKTRSHLIPLKVYGKYGKWLNKFSKTAAEISPIIIVHNGVICTSPNGIYPTIKEYNKIWEKLSVLLLLKDRYRPNENISRNNIGKCDLEAECELSIIGEKVRNKYGILLLNNPNTSIPLCAKQYWNLLERRQEFADEMESHINQMKTAIYRWGKNSKELFEIQQSDLHPLVYYVGYRISNEVIYNELFSAYLKMNYLVYVDFGTNSRMKLYISQAENKLPRAYGDYFPAFLFVLPLHEDQKYLTCKQIESRYACNQLHRLSQFMLSHAEMLHDKAPGIFQNMISILIKDNDEDLLCHMNTQLKTLQKFPGNPFGITNDLYLTEDDLYSCDEEN